MYRERWNNGSSSSRKTKKKETYTAVRDLDPRPGQIVLVSRARDGQLFVRKRVKQFMAAESALLAQLHHPHIIALDEVFEEGEDDLVQILEYAARGDLRDLMGSRKGKPFTEGELLSCFAALASAVQYMHTKGIVHRDIKPDNVFITQEGTVKLGDFGLGLFLREPTGHRAATPIVSSPSPPSRARPATAMSSKSRAAAAVMAAVGSRPSTASRTAKMKTEVSEASDGFIPTEAEQLLLNQDIEALGRILYEMAVLHHPAPGNGGSRILSVGVIPESVSPGVRQLLHHMLRADGNEAPIRLWKLLDGPLLRPYRQNGVALPITRAAEVSTPTLTESLLTSSASSRTSSPPAEREEKEKEKEETEEDRRRAERQREAEAAATARLLTQFSNPIGKRSVAVVEECVREGADLLAKTDAMRRPLLHTLFWRGDDVNGLAACLRCSPRPIDFTRADQDGFTPLHLLPCGSTKSNANAVELLELLLRRLQQHSSSAADVVDWRQPDRWGRGFIVFVAKWGRLAAFLPVLRRGVAGVFDREGGTVLKDLRLDLPQADWDQLPEEDRRLMPYVRVAKPMTRR